MIRINTYPPLFNTLSAEREFAADGVFFVDRYLKKDASRWKASKNDH